MARYTVITLHPHDNAVRKRDVDTANRVGPSSCPEAACRIVARHFLQPGELIVAAIPGRVQVFDPHGAGHAMLGPDVLDDAP